MFGKPGSLGSPVLLGICRKSHAPFASSTSSGAKPRLGVVLHNEIVLHSPQNLRFPLTFGLFKHSPLTPLYRPFFRGLGLWHPTPVGRHSPKKDLSRFPFQGHGDLAALRAAKSPYFLFPLPAFGKGGRGDGLFPPVAQKSQTPGATCFNSHTPPVKPRECVLRAFAVAI